MKRANRLVRNRRQAGLTLVELLVVLAIIATLAGILYPAIVDSFQKSQASMAAQRIDAVEKAKVQYRLDHPGTALPSNDITPLQPYLVQLGQSIASLDTLNDGTGGKISTGDLNATAFLTPNDAGNTRFAALLKQYHVPTAVGKEGDMPVTAGP